MSQLYLSSVAGRVHKAETFGDLKLTPGKAGAKWQSRTDYNACETLALTCLCSIFSNAFERHCLAYCGLTWKKLYVTSAKATAVLLQRYYGKIFSENIRCVDVECAHVPAFLGRWHSLEDTHKYTRAPTHSVLCMRWLTCRDIWLVLDTLFGAAQWLNTTHNGRKKEKEKAME